MQTLTQIFQQHSMFVAIASCPYCQVVDVFDSFSAKKRKVTKRRKRTETGWSLEFTKTKITKENCFNFGKVEPEMRYIKE
ncbi:CLUMA_CG000297, isoform A [Clunio marinus]|uniref:CLUMA_CG000297, isoform A n=1 Tax=Clunio marinus TaxID=568069 RepID=A0A1J1HG47_9DIPT|nr:CLUMA_CG000297, isoform A [Clunio marinus]